MIDLRFPHIGRRDLLRVLAVGAGAAAATAAPIASAAARSTDADKKQRARFETSCGTRSIRIDRS